MRAQLRLLQQLGCNIKQCRLDDVGAALDGMEAITLVAHWDKDDRIELADGLHDWTKVADVIVDSGFNGVLDLCICHPKPMVPYLKSHSMAVLKHTGLNPSNIIVWLGIYGLMAAKMNEEPISFGDALVAATCELGRVQINEVITESGCKATRSSKTSSCA